VPHALILGIESSCDETSAAVVRAGTQVLSNVVASQLVHADYGGVVPELASREHLRAIVPVVREALQRAGLAYADLDAIAVTAGPGLAGALLVGITFAKSLAFGLGKPLIAVNHLEGHIHAVLMQTESTLTNTAPLLALVVSGGHTHLYLANRTPQGTWTYRNVGKTLDDAAGEAFDKAAKLLGLPYPGGPWIDALAPFGDPAAVPFTLAQIKSKASGNTAPKLARERAALKDTGFSPYKNAESEQGPFTTEGGAAKRFDLSFSGLKTALRRHVELHALHPAISMRMEALRAAGLDKANPRDPATIASALTHFDQPTLNLIASFQYTIVKNLTRATFAAAEHFQAGAVLVSGGVSANSALRASMTTLAAQHNLPIAFPTIALSTDNAAMIAAAAWPKFLAQDFADDTLEPTPQLRLG
jgi:N6-L-threonylcarbamoyladenine synthase